MARVLALEVYVISCAIVAGVLAAVGLMAVGGLFLVLMIVLAAVGFYRLRVTVDEGKRWRAGSPSPPGL